MLLNKPIVRGRDLVSDGECKDHAVLDKQLNPSSTQPAATAIKDAAATAHVRGIARELDSYCISY